MARPRLPKLGGRSAAKTPTTSTTYTATGAAQPLTVEVEDGSSQPVKIRETVPELASAFVRLQTYAKMMNDAGVDVSMRAAKTPVLGAEFYMEAFSDSDEDADIADFVWQNLAEGMSAPFINSLEDILHMYEDGYSVLEKVYENRVWTPKRTGANAKMYTMLKKLAVRPTNTLKDFTYDNNGGPVEVVQNAIQGDNKPIEKKLDTNKLLIFTFGRKGGDLTGKSLLRTAYPHWYYKTHMYKIDAIQKERHALGVPRGKLLPGWKPKDLELLRQLLKNIRTNEESYFIQTPNVEIDFAEVHGNLVDVLASASHHNIMILLNVMVQFLALGMEASGGGRATSGAQTDIYMKSLKYVANHLTDVMNMYLIPELVVYNFKTSNFPKLRVRNIGETRDLQMLGSALGNLYSQEALSTDLNTENWVRRVFDMPQKLESDFNAQVAAAKAAATQSTNGNAPTNGNGNGNAKGAIKQRPGDGGNNGKPPSAFAEHHVHLPHNDPQPVEINNEYEFSAPPVEVRIEEGAISAPAPIIHVHMPEKDEPVQQIAKSAKVVKNDDGTTTVEYEYE
jgi:hypothetical protein